MSCRSRYSTCIFIESIYLGEIVFLQAPLLSMLSKSILDKSPSELLKFPNFEFERDVLEVVGLVVGAWPERLVAPFMCGGGLLNPNSFGGGDKERLGL